MRVGFDFDNTIVCYDDVFAAAAGARGLVAAGRAQAREHLKGRGREDEWTELQGEVYGLRMASATAYPGALEFLARLRYEGVSVAIISHKTRFPARGPKVDLHQAARRWLGAHGLGDEGRVPVFFEATRDAKIARIVTEGCDVFVDDLPEVLTDPAFPPSVQRILFDPSRPAPDAAEHFVSVGSWRELGERLVGLRRAA